jgi:hypothetical protein
VKHDEKIMVWGCFCAHQVGRIHLVDGIMNAIQYVNILDDHMTQSAANLWRGEPYIFQQDNDPKHTSKAAKEFFVNHKVNVLPWPSQSPDLNPIENLWSILGHVTRKRQANTKQELFNELQVAWQNIPQETLHSLVASMPRRCQAVIDANGYATKY